MASIIWVPAAFSAATCFLYWLSINIPDVSIETENGGVNSTALTFPSSLEELTSLASLLSYYNENHGVYVLVLFMVAYLYKQTFAIPGSLFMNLLGGALYGISGGFPLTCLLSAGGATLCYLLSKHCGKKYIVKYFPSRIKPLQMKVEENSDSLLFFLLFLRFVPMSPNWFMNIAAPIVNVPIHLFFLSVLIGLMPYNFICVQTGCLLSQLSSVSDILNTTTCLKLVATATAALVPGLLLRKLHSNKERTKKDKCS